MSAVFDVHAVEVGLAGIRYAQKFTLWRRVGMGKKRRRVLGRLLILASLEIGACFEMSWSAYS